jgi:hypothetical protein
MHEFYFKEPEKKIKHPSDDPNRKTYEAKAEERIKGGKVTFKSEGERLDYERRINSNPNNIYGLPEFFPPEILKFSYGDIHEATECDKDGGCCVARNNYVCPRCGQYNPPH